MSVPVLRHNDAIRRQAGGSSFITGKGIIVCVGVTFVIILSLTNNITFQKKTSMYAKIGESLVSSSSIGEPSSTAASSSSQRSSALAYDESYGLLDDISDETWNKLKARVQRQRQVEDRTPLTKDIRKYQLAAEWYGRHFEPEFTCLHEERTGGDDGTGTGNGDGPKWICNPRRLKEVAKERWKKEGKGCLIYSVGSHGDFGFEDAIASLTDVVDDDELPTTMTNLCEIHVFDMDDYSDQIPTKYKESGTIVFHPWGLKGQNEVIENNPQNKVYYSFQEIVQKLGHENRVIDIFKIDCEGCEWTSYKDWLSAPVEIHQIQVELHRVSKNTVNFFGDLQDAGYVIFHKEPNTISIKYGVTCVEYSFLKLKKSFFTLEEKLRKRKQ